MSDNEARCPVCGEGESRAVHGGRTDVSHLDCVRQVADNWEAVWRGRLELAEAERDEYKAALRYANEEYDLLRRMKEETP